MEPQNTKKTRKKINNFSAYSVVSVVKKEVFRE